jgi:hypothetical protein
MHQRFNLTGNLEKFDILGATKQALSTLISMAADFIFPQNYPPRTASIFLFFCFVPYLIRDSDGSTARGRVAGRRRTISSGEFLLAEGSSPVALSALCSSPNNRRPRPRPVRLCAAARWGSLQRPSRPPPRTPCFAGRTPPGTQPPPPAVQCSHCIDSCEICVVG